MHDEFGIAIYVTIKSCYVSVHRSICRSRVRNPYSRVVYTSVLRMEMRRLSPNGCDRVLGMEHIIRYILSISVQIFHDMNLIYRLQRFAADQGAHLESKIEILDYKLIRQPLTRRIINCIINTFLSYVDNNVS